MQRVFRVKTFRTRRCQKIDKINFSSFSNLVNIMIKKAILPVAGLGTRFLPASKSIPKEMVTVVDRPAIEYVVREAVAAGIEQIILVTHSSKASIENYFDRNF